MDQVKLLSIVVDSDDENVGVRIFEIVRYAVAKRFSIGLLRDAADTSCVAAALPEDAARLDLEIRAFCQNLLVCAVRSMGWQAKIYRPYGRRAIPLHILAYTHLMLRGTQTTSIGGAQVAIMDTRNSAEYIVSVGGPFKTTVENSRAFLYGQVVGLARKSGEWIFAVIHDISHGDRIFQVPSLSWIEEWKGTTAFVVLERFRGGRRCWRLAEVFELEESLF